MPRTSGHVLMVWPSSLSRCNKSPKHRIPFSDAKTWMQQVQQVCSQVQQVQQDPRIWEHNWPWSLYRISNVDIWAHTARRIGKDRGTCDRFLCCTRSKNLSNSSWVQHLTWLYLTAVTALQKHEETWTWILLVGQKNLSVDFWRPVLGSAPLTWKCRQNEEGEHRRA